MSSDPIDSARLSRFGRRFAAGAGTYQLMSDLGAAAEVPGTVMLGGGNPSRIAAVEDRVSRELQGLAQESEVFGRWGGRYSPPEGDLACREALAALLHRKYGWPLSRANIAFTPGSQSAFFMLLNAFAGGSDEAPASCVWLPSTPDYIGYPDAMLEAGLIRGARSKILDLGNHRFRYQLAYEAFEIPGDAGVVCLSRPANPTGNVVSADELAKLDQAARAAGIPLILDCAYGSPFPNIVYVEAEPIWNDNVILCLSLSKLGLPGLRAGIVVANEKIIRLLGSMMAAMHLAPASLAPTLIERLVVSGEILTLAQHVIRPHYEGLRAHALASLEENLAGIDWRVHVPEGAFFLWLWLPNLPVPSLELYERLKARGLIVLSGHSFFLPSDSETPHHRECLRVSYAQPPDVLDRGFEILSRELRSL